MFSILINRNNRIEEYHITEFADILSLADDPRIDKAELVKAIDNEDWGQLSSINVKVIIKLSEAFADYPHILQKLNAYCQKLAIIQGGELTTSALVKALKQIPYLAELLSSETMRLSFYHSLQEIYDDLRAFPQYQDTIVLKIMAQKEQVLIFITNLVELVMLVNCFAAQHALSNHLAKFLRIYPAAFIKLVRTTTDLHKLCSLVPALHTGCDVPVSLAAFMAEETNGCFHTPLLKLLDTLCLHASESTEKRLLNGGRVKVARLALATYGNYYFKQELVRVIKFFSFTKDNEELYCQLSLASKKIMLVLPSESINALFNDCGIVFEWYYTEAYSYTEDIKYTRWSENIKTALYKETYYGLIHPHLINYLTGLVQQNYTDTPIRLWEFGCGEATVLRGVCKNLQPWCAGIGFDEHQAIVAAARRKAQGLKCEFYQGNTLKLLTLCREDENNLVFSQLGLKYATIYVFCGSLNVEVLESNSKGTRVLQQLARFAKLEDSVVIIGHSPALTCTSVLKRIGWNCRVEAIADKPCYYLQKMSPEQHLTALSKHRRKNPTVIDFSSSANPLAALCLLCEAKDDWSALQKIDTTDAYFAKGEQAEFATLLKSHAALQNPKMLSKSIFIYPPKDNPKKLAHAISGHSFFELTANKKWMREDTLPFTSNFHQRWGQA